MIDSLKILGWLNDFRVDRITLSSFNTNWEGPTSKVSLGTDYRTIHEGNIIIEDLGLDETIHTPLSTPMNLDKQDQIILHLYPTTEILENKLSIILSDSENLTTVLYEQNIGELSAETQNTVILDIAEEDQKLLSNIRSIGLKSNTDLTGTSIYLSKFDAHSTEYIITQEELTNYYHKGEQFIKSKLNKNTIPPSLQEPTYMAAAAYLWMKTYSVEKDNWDFGNATSRNYGKNLLRDAETQCEEYLHGGDTNIGESGGESLRQINTNLVMGSEIKY